MKNGNGNGHGPHSEESAIQFPCDFMIKMMGRTEGDFEKNALDIVKQHFPDVDDAHIQKRPSKDNNYISLSVTVLARTKQELDALYQDLSKCKDILMVLWR